VTTIHHLNARAVGSRTGGDTTDALLGVFDVAPVDGVVLRAAPPRSPAGELAALRVEDLVAPLLRCSPSVDLAEYTS